MGERNGISFSLVSGEGDGEAQSSRPSISRWKTRRKKEKNGEFKTETNPLLLYHGVSGRISKGQINSFVGGKGGCDLVTKDKCLPPFMILRRKETGIKDSTTITSPQSALCIRRGPDMKFFFKKRKDRNASRSSELWLLSSEPRSFSFVFHAIVHGITTTLTTTLPSSSPGLAAFAANRNARSPCSKGTRCVTRPSVSPSNLPLANSAIAAG